MKQEDRERLVEDEEPDVVVHYPVTGRKSDSEDEVTPSCSWTLWFILLLIFISPAIYCFIRHAVVPILTGSHHLDHPVAVNVSTPGPPPTTYSGTHMRLH